MEANKYSWHTIIHLKNNDCTSAPAIGYGGTICDPKYLFTEVKTKSQTETYGPGEKYTINTEKPF